MNIVAGLEMIQENTFGFIQITINHVTGKRQIGQRILDQKGDWKRYIGSGVYLMNSIKVHGANAFSKEIIDVAENADDLNEKEIYWIAFYDAVANKDFYNISPGGQDRMTWREYYSEHDPDKYNEINERRIASFKRRVYQYDLEGNFIQEHSSITEAAKAVDGNCAHINSVCWGDREKAQGFKWRFADEGSWERSSTRGNRTNHNPTNKKAIIQYSLDGNFIREFSSVCEAARFLGKPPAHISATCLGKRNKAYGQIWRFAA